MILTDYFRERRRLRQAIKYSDHSTLFTPEPKGEIICLDTETSSLDPKSASLLAIGAILIKDGRILHGERLDLHVRPTQVITGDSIRIHGLRNKDLENSEPLDSALEQLLAFIGSRPILGYWIKFDMTLLKRLIKQQYGFTLPNRTIELSDIYRQKVRKAHPDETVNIGFEAIANTLNISPMGRHTAMGDSLSTALMYLRLTQGVTPYQSRMAREVN
ncbi:hypothetical protein ACH42_05185 [Endozoicomonas sp. (ex Bugula neritina AB1)]|nr:hypothetical protein ACH42_05185 [Endozoicomonas sp. (ex Bugula neritina AB1)]